MLPYKLRLGVSNIDLHGSSADYQNDFSCSHKQFEGKKIKKANKLLKCIEQEVFLKPYFCFNLLKKKVANGISTRIPSNIAYKKKSNIMSHQEEQNKISTKPQIRIILNLNDFISEG